MKTREILRDKEDCYATEKVDKCDDKCLFYWTCLSYRHSLKIGDVKNRDDILNHECQ